MEQLFASLESDRIKVNKTTINKAKDGNSSAILAIGFAYDKREEYAKAMVWYQLSANQNNANAQNSIAILYYEGNGVPQNFDIALTYYLKAAGNNDRYAMANIGYRFSDGKGVPVAPYKALEWFIKSEKTPENVKELNQQGVHLEQHDKKDMMRAHKSMEQKMKHISSIEITNLRKEIQALSTQAREKEQRITLLEKEKEEAMNENKTLKQSIDSLKQQLAYQTEAINSMNTTSETFRSLIQSKNSEIELLKKDNQIFISMNEEMREIKRKIEEYQQYVHELLSSSKEREQEGVALNVNGTQVKSELDLKEGYSRLCETANKKRKVSSDDT
ncbi:HCP-like protein [Backusella circina FSU 941]|nr:HCP-like protein [Backusella circina FSU 941]